MASNEGRSTTPSAFPLPEIEAFTRLNSTIGKKATRKELPKFVKKLEDIPKVALPQEYITRVALSLVDQALIGQFTGLWPTLKATEGWVQRN